MHVDWVEVFNIKLDAGTCTGIGTTTMRKPNLRFQDIDLKVDPQLNVVEHKVGWVYLLSSNACGSYGLQELNFPGTGLSITRGGTGLSIIHGLVLDSCSGAMHVIVLMSLPRWNFWKYIWNKNYERINFRFQDIDLKVECCLFEHKLNESVLIGLQPPACWNWWKYSLTNFENYIYKTLRNMWKIDFRIKNLEFQLQTVVNPSRSWMSSGACLC